MNTSEDQMLAAALDRYGMAQARATLLGNLWNSVYAVNAPDGNRYSLRVCSPVIQEPETIRHELEWLDFMASRRKVIVPRPVRNLQGDLLTHLATVAGKRFCCLFEWVEGQEARTCLHASTLRRIGAAVANLHQIAQEFPFPDENSQFRRDYRFDEVLVASHRMWIEEHKEEIGVENASLLHSAVAWFLEAVGQFEKAPNTYGMIHADLHFGNFLVSGDQVGIIDFDQVGRGYFLYDLAVLWVELQYEQVNVAIAWQDFTTGYRQVMELPFRVEKELSPFIVAVHLGFLDWLYNTPNPEVRTQYRQRVPTAYAAIHAFTRSPWIGS